MSKQLGVVCAAVCALTITAVAVGSAHAQEVKEKPPMYSYVGNWAIPRAQWAEMDKNTAADAKVLDKALAAGTIIGHGNDVNLVHEADGATHDDWWSAMSMAEVINVLEQFYQSGTATTPVLASATKHYDNIYVSRFYNWHPGTYKNVYTHVGSYKLKADAPDDAVETLSKSLIVPLLEKMLADGAIHEYEIDTQAIHSDAPGTFSVVYIAANADGLDKVNAAVQETLKSSPLTGPAFGSMTESAAHRDYLARTSATYK
jgi:hypothetical protein